MASDGKSLTGLWFDGQKYYYDSLLTKLENKDLPIFKQTKEWLDIYFQGKNPDFVPPVSYSSTPFRCSVWKLLQKIPYGKTVTYGEIAKIIAKENGVQRMSAQAVGQAVGHNPISIIIPCHRVVGSSGSLTGYGGGIEKKIALLKLENIEMDKLFIPSKGTAI